MFMTNPVSGIQFLLKIFYLFVQSKSINQDKADLLYKLLLRRDDALFENYCSALTDTGQRHVVKKLKEQRVTDGKYGIIVM
jgi:hypothetical protein